MIPFFPENNGLNATVLVSDPPERNFNEPAPVPRPGVPAVAVTGSRPTYDLGLDPGGLDGPTASIGDVDSASAIPDERTLLLEKMDAEIAARRNQLAASLTRLQGALLDPADFFRRYPPPVLLMEGGADPGKHRLLTNEYLKQESGGIPLPADEEGRAVIRRAVALDKFDGRGADSDTEFHLEILNEATVQRDESARRGYLRKKARGEAFDSLLGSEEGEGWQGVRGELLAMPGAADGNEADYLSVFQNEQRTALRGTERFRGALTQLWSGMNPAAREEGDMGAPESVSSLKPEEVDHLLGIAGMLRAGLNEGDKASLSRTFRMMVESLPEESSAAIRAGLQRAENGGGMDPAALMDSIYQSAAGSQQPVPKRSYERLEKALLASGLYQSVTAAMSGAWDKEIRRRPDGNWDVAIVAMQDGKGTIDKTLQGAWGLSVSAGQKLGARLEPWHAGYQKIQKVLHGFQQEEELSDEDFSLAWHDLGTKTRPWEDGERIRVLSDGNLRPNPTHSDWLDDGKAEALIAQSGGSPAAKETLRRNLPEMQRLSAQHKMLAYETAAAVTTERKGSGKVANIGTMKSPMDWAKEQGLMDQAGSPAFILRYEAEIISKLGWSQGLLASVNKGVIGVASQLAGIGGMVGWEAAGELGGELTNVNGLIGEGSFDTGIVGQIVEQLPGVIVQVAGTKGLTSVATAANATARTRAAVGMLAGAGMAGAQTLGGTFSESIAAGDNVGTAREKAFRAAVTTTLITGLFSATGAGGLEKLAAGRAAGEVTMRSLLASASREELLAGMKVYGRSLLGNSVGEMSEETLDSVVQAFLNSAPDTNLADAWANALRAGALGMASAGGTHVATRTGVPVFAPEGGGLSFLPFSNDGIQFVKKSGPAADFATDVLAVTTDESEDDGSTDGERAPGISRITC